MKYSIALEKQLEWQRHLRILGVNGLFLEHLHRMASSAEPYYVNTDIVRMLHRVSEDPSLTDFALFPSDLPTPVGYVYLEEPISLRYSDSLLAPEGWLGGGEPERQIRWFAWNMEGDMVSLCLDGYHLDVARCFSQHRFGVNQVRSFTETGSAWCLFYSFLSFISQRLLSAVGVAPDRATRRRAGLRPEHVPLIRVVELRAKRASSLASSDHEPRDWSCRWMVRGHWRNQPYPKEDVVRPKWIAPYVKGPDEAPLKPPRATVFAVVR